MENKNLQSYGYLLNCPDEMLNSVNNTMKNKGAFISWDNFNVGDAFYAENIYRCVMADHTMKRITFVIEEEYKNKFELKYNNRIHKKPDMRGKVREYISEFDKEIKRLEEELIEMNGSDINIISGTEIKLETLIEVRNDLKGRLDEVI